MKLTFILTFILSSLLLFSQDDKQENPLPYDLDSPTKIYVLPEFLEEVSGLTYYAPNQFAMLNDEQGRMYVYDIEEKDIVHKVRFEGRGDFEGIERVGEYIYAIKSNGDMHRFKVDVSGVVEKLKSPFKSENNVEGLGYDIMNNRLLVALKGDGDIEDVNVKGKAIYAFDLSTDKYLKIPPFSVSHKALEKVVGDDFKLGPSGVAVHPFTQEVYVVSATRRAILIFGTDGKPKHLKKLRSSLFPQPEGIAFDETGNLYITNEVDGEGGTLLEFKTTTN